MSLFDFILPRFCLTCGRRLISSEQHLCAHCLLSLPRVDLYPSVEDNRMVRRYWGKVDVCKGASVLYYVPEDYVSHIVKAFKYGGNKRIAVFMGRVMAQELMSSHFFDDIDCIVPVPISLLRTLGRGYNQCHHLARGIGSVTGIPYETRLLKKKCGASSQTRKSHQERIDNAVGAYRLTDDNSLIQRYAHKHLLLLDDVVTTGSTTLSCTKELKKIPGVQVSILSLALTKTRD